MQLPDGFRLEYGGPISTEHIVNPPCGCDFLEQTLWRAWNRASEFIVLSGFTESKKAQRLRGVRAQNVLTENMDTSYLLEAVSYGIPFEEACEMFGVASGRFRTNQPNLCSCYRGPFDSHGYYR
jgi:hypothetical protein